MICYVVLVGGKRTCYTKVVKLHGFRYACVSSGFMRRLGKGVVNTRFKSVLEVLMDTNEVKHNTFIVREMLPTTFFNLHVCTVHQ